MARTPEGRERRRIAARRRYHENLEKSRTYSREYQRQHKRVRPPGARRAEYLRKKGQYQNRFLLRRYGITLDQRNQMFANQGGRCAACGCVMTLTEGNIKTAAHIDHDHSTGCVRALLCARCNIVLGQCRESIEILLSLVEYVRSHCSL